MRWQSIESDIGVFRPGEAAQPPFQDGPENRQGGEVDAGGAEAHDQAEAFEAAVLGEKPEEPKAAGGDESAEQQGAVADVPSSPGSARKFFRFQISMDHEDAVFVAGADEDWKSEEIGEIPTGVEQAHEGNEHGQSQGQHADGQQSGAEAAKIQKHEEENQGQRVNGGMEERLMNRAGGVIDIRGDAGDARGVGDLGDGGFDGSLKCFQILADPEVLGGFDVQGEVTVATLEMLA
ncbi:MAG: hypothetical protein ABSE84_12820, partial [Isosphaeraceae bacterium]